MHMVIIFPKEMIYIELLHITNRCVVLVLSMYAGRTTYYLYERGTISCLINFWFIVTGCLMDMFCHVRVGDVELNVGPPMTRSNYNMGYSNYICDYLINWDITIISMSLRFGITHQILGKSNIFT